MSNPEIILPGKIAVQKDSTCFIYNNSNKSETSFKIKNDKTIQYGGFKWMNSSNKFIGIEYFENSKVGTYKSNVVCFDSLGVIIDRIYKSAEDEIAWYGYLSKNDKRLLFTTQKSGTSKENPLEGLTRIQTLMIMDFNKKEIIKKIENFGASPNFDLEESPWLYDEDHFIYSIRGGREIIVDNDTINKKQDQPGVYIYDIVTDQKKLLVADGYSGICSPIDHRVGYIKDQSIWVLDLRNGTIKNIYKGKSNEKISHIHWTPDGKYIYLVYFLNYQLDLFKSGEKLIELSTNKEVSFKKIQHGFDPYTWK